MLDTSAAFILALVHCGVQPSRARGRMPMDEQSARLFCCARCESTVVICRPCDRGQIYCSRNCARRARCDAQRAAGARYQRTRQGRHAHAARARAYRARRKNVTHHGSAAVAPDALLICVPPRSESTIARWGTAPADPIVHVCCRCGTPCGPVVRVDFLHTSARARFRWTRRR